MNVSAHHKLFAMVMSLGLIAGCSSTGETTEDGAYGSDVSAVDQEGGSTVYGGDDDGGVSSSEMSEEQRREAEARAARAEEAAMREITTFYFDFDTPEFPAASAESAAPSELAELVAGASETFSESFRIRWSRSM